MLEFLVHDNYGPDTNIYFGLIIGYEEYHNGIRYTGYSMIPHTKNSVIIQKMLIPQLLIPNNSGIPGLPRLFTCPKFILVHQHLFSSTTIILLYQHYSGPSRFMPWNIFWCTSIRVFWVWKLCATLTSLRMDLRWHNREFCTTRVRIVENKYVVSNCWR